MAIESVLSKPGRFDALTADHPGVGEICPSCDTVLRVGDKPALVNGYPATPDDAAKFEAGRAVNLICVLAHESCAFPAEEPV